MIHNATEDLKGSLPGWQPYIEQLRQVARLLHNKPDRLLATCFSRVPHLNEADRFRSFQHTVYEGRWAEALSASMELRPLMDSLRAAWDVQAYSFGEVQPERNNDQGEKG